MVFPSHRSPHYGRCTSLVSNARTLHNRQGRSLLFCDTDSMCIVASPTGGWVGCPNEPRIKALSWKDVEEIAAKFESLNCYDRTKVPGSILKIEKVNFKKGKQIELSGFATSAKRYVL